MGSRVLLCSKTEKRISRRHSPVREIPTGAFRGQWYFTSDCWIVRVFDWKSRVQRDLLISRFYRDCSIGDVFARVFCAIAYYCVCVYVFNIDSIDHHTPALSHSI